MMYCRAKMNGYEDVDCLDLRSFGLEGAFDVRSFEAFETFYPQKRMDHWP